MSLVRQLSLNPDNTLKIEPVSAIRTLRSSNQSVGETHLPANQETRLVGIEGNAVELSLEIDPQEAREISIDVLCSPNREEYTSIKFYRHGLFAFNQNGRNIRQDALVLDTSRLSLLPDVTSRPPEVAPFELGDGELLKLQVFIDKSVVEVFANHRQCLTLRVYPERKDSLGISIRAQGRDAVLKSLEAWYMKRIWD